MLQVARSCIRETGLYRGPILTSPPSFPDPSARDATAPAQELGPLPYGAEAFVAEVPDARCQLDTGIPSTAERVRLPAESLAKRRVIRLLFTCCGVECRQVVS